jgi:hypothetical protein
MTAGLPKTTPTVWQTGCPLSGVMIMTPKRLLQTILFTVVLIATLTISVLPAYAADIPALPDFSTFASNAKNGEPGIVRGIYVDGLFALKVVQQPKENAGYVSKTPDALTEFRNARQQKNVGLLAHNYLAGQYFTQLKIGQIIRVVYGDGKIENFIVTEIARYQAISPNSPYSDFTNLATGERSNVESVFKKAYAGPHHLTLQTCIAKDNELSWGRLFIIAEPMKNSVQTINSTSDF